MRLQARRAGLGDPEGGSVGAEEADGERGVREDAGHHRTRSHRQGGGAEDAGVWHDGRPAAGRRTMPCIIPMPAAGRRTRSCVIPMPATGRRTRPYVIPMHAARRRTRPYVFPMPAAGRRTRSCVIPMHAARRRTRPCVIPMPVVDDWLRSDHSGVSEF